MVIKTTLVDLKLTETRGIEPRHLRRWGFAAAISPDRRGSSTEPRGRVIAALSRFYRFRISNTPAGESEEHREHQRLYVT